MNEQGQNTIVISESAMEDLRLSRIEEELKQEITGAQLIVFQSEMNFDAELEILRFCRANSQAQILYNPAPFRDDYDYGLILPLVDFFIPNETEYEQLLQKKVEIPSTVQIILTLGEHGCKVNGNIIPPVKVTSVDSTGAGDCWIGGFCAGLVDGMSMEDAAGFANKAAAISVTRKGAAVSIPDITEIQ